jgi:hypothetical protein
MSAATPKIFVSYSQSDRDCAIELVSRVEAEGLRCWIAPRDISPAADWAAEIIEAISAARIMVLVFSSRSNESPQVRREVERAVDKRVRILPFRIEDVLPAKSLEYFLSAQHWLDAFPGPRDAHYARLCVHLRAWLASGDGNIADGLAAAQPRHSPAQLEQVQAHLARCVGPIARVLVKRAAARSTNLEELLQLLSAELDSERERSAFQALCRALPRGDPP